MKKGLLYVLVVLTLVMTLCACETNDDGISNASGITIDEAALLSYTIVRSDLAEGELVRCGMDVREAFIASGYELKLTTDFYREGIAEYQIREYEILVGETNRPETEEFLDSLQMWQYGYALIGQKIVIAGHDDAATRAAVDEFNRTIASRTPFRFSAADNYVYGEVKEGKGKIYSVLSMNFGSGAVDDAKISDFAAAITNDMPGVVLIQNAHADTADKLTPKIQANGYELGADYEAGTNHDLIYYNTAVYTYSSAGHLKMSQIPTLSDDEKGSFTYCVLRCADTKDKYVFCTTELSAISEENIQSRMAIFGNFAGNCSDLPIVFGGTFNGAADSPVCASLTDFGFADSMRLSTESSGECTTDYIYVTHNRIAVASCTAAPNYVYTEFQKAK